MGYDERGKDEKRGHDNVLINKKAETLEASAEYVVAGRGATPWRYLILLLRSCSESTSVRIVTSPSH